MSPQQGAGDPPASGITRARFRVVGPDGPGEWVDVHFNPESLEYTITNNIQQRGNSDSNKQYVSQSSGKLTMTLVFDTTHSGVDVRESTDKFGALMKPTAEGKKKVASVVEFNWGAYKFMGVLESFKQTIDFFSSTGVPLRASVNLTLAQQDKLFEPSDYGDKQTVTGNLVRPSGDALDTAGGDPRSARDLAASNDEEQPRFLSGDELEAPDEVELRPPSAFAPAGIELGAGLDIGLGLELDVGLELGLGVGIGGGLDIGLGLGLDVNLGLGLDIGLGLDLDIGLGLGLDGGASLGGDAGGGGLTRPSSSGGVPAGSPVAGGSPSGSPLRSPSSGGSGSGSGSSRSTAARNEGPRVVARPRPKVFASIGDTPAGPSGPLWGSSASAGVPAVLGAFGGLRPASAPKPPRRFRLVDTKPSPPERVLNRSTTGFEIGGRAVDEGPSGLRADVGAQASLSSHIRFDEE